MQTLCRYLEYKEDEYRVGKTKVFIRFPKTLFATEDAFQVSSVARSSESKLILDLDVDSLIVEFTVSEITGSLVTHLLYRPSRSARGTFWVEVQV